MLTHEGPARIFESEEAASAAILEGKINPGDVVVIRYEGPRGGPGMQEMLAPTSSIAGMGLDAQVALITRRPFSPAPPGGPRSDIFRPKPWKAAPLLSSVKVRRSKSIFPNRSISLAVDDQEIEKRLKEWKEPEPKITGGNSGPLRPYGQFGLQRRGL